MNKTYKFLKNLSDKAQQIVAVDFYKNLKIFDFIVAERFIVTSAELNEFMKNLPNYVLDEIKNENSVCEILENAEDFGDKKIYSIKSLDEEEISVDIVINNIGQINQIVFYNDRIRMTLTSSQDIVILERNNSCLKLINLLKDHYSLNKGKTIDGEFVTVATFEKSKVERDVVCSEMLLG